jgi:beta-glucosidase
MAEARFPADFLWGTATASYQIEGAVREDGRGETIWDRFSSTPGNIYLDQNGDVACDHYHRYRDDIRLMRDIGLRSYRFSIAWSRIFPRGGGGLNPAGLDFYQRLVDELLTAGIVPMATIYHWDLPQALQDQGGWQRRDTVKYYLDYAATLFERLGDRVKLWITQNEPQVVSHVGHGTGEHAPGIRDEAAALEVSHHLLLSHAQAVKLYQEYRGAEGKIGIALNLSPVYALSDDSPEDRQAALYCDGAHNRWFLDPVFTGSYPKDMLEISRNRFNAPTVQAGDEEDFKKAAIDFLGVNYYLRLTVRGPEKRDELFRPVRPEPGGAQLTEMGWEQFPEGLHAILMRVQKDYDPAEIYVTENGAAFKDQTIQDGQVQDDDRIKFLKDHFAAAHRAMQQGVKLKGYQVWSLMDNFEWSYGYSKRFGIIRVDCRTLERRPKKSAGWYERVIAESGF